MYIRPSIRPPPHRPPRKIRDNRPTIGELGLNTRTQFPSAPDTGKNASPLTNSDSSADEGKNHRQNHTYHRRGPSPCATGERSEVPIQQTCTVRCSQTLAIDDERQNFKDPNPPPPLNPEPRTPAIYRWVFTPHMHVFVGIVRAREPLIHDFAFSCSSFSASSSETIWLSGTYWAVCCERVV